MTIEQYNTLLGAAPLLEAALVKQDIQVVRPDYDADVNAATEAPKDEDAAGGGDVAEEKDKEATAAEVKQDAEDEVVGNMDDGE